ncbi:hypothetical protein DD595_25420, partial [Enterobacter cloacae complex sp. 4DZ3-17B2]|uniref:hypothetical protein n=1 Tax=Enterobacter cloacae complex sp. 4DZ3-17B2 TaxID=2511990 RepID=UPI001026F712
QGSGNSTQSHETENEIGEIEMEEEIDSMDKIVSDEAALTNLNKILELLHVSPISSWKDRRSEVAEKSKIIEIKQSLDRELRKVFTKVRPADDDIQVIVDELKEKIALADRNSEKVTLLTMVPKSWKARRIEKEFNVPYCLKTERYINNHYLMCNGRSSDSAPNCT